MKSIFHDDVIHLDFRASTDLDNTLQWQLPIVAPAVAEKTPESSIPEKPPLEPDTNDLPAYPSTGDDEDRTMEDVVVFGSNCPVCGKTFATKNNCRRHVREMHGMNPISKARVQTKHEPTVESPVITAKESCSICGAESETKFELRRHLVQHHSLTMMDACSLSEKELPLSNSLPTLVKPAGVLSTPSQEQVPNTPVPASKVNQSSV